MRYSDALVKMCNWVAGERKRLESQIGNNFYTLKIGGIVRKWW